MGRSKWASISVLCLCQVAVMALWFSASAVVPSLTVEYGLSGFTQSLLTSSVQAGFVAGSLVSALFGLADRLDPRRFFMASALAATAANAGHAFPAWRDCKLGTGFGDRPGSDSQSGNTTNPRPAGPRRGRA